MLRRMWVGAVLCAAMALGWSGQAFALTFNEAAAGAGAKLSPTFQQRLSYVRPDGLMQVMVRMQAHTTLTETSAAAETTSLEWYRSSPAFLGLVTPVQLHALLLDPSVRYVEPDHPVQWTLATSAIDVRARNAMWSFQGTGFGSLSSLADGLDADAATGAGATAAILDSGIDATNHDFSGFDCAIDAPMSQCDSRIKHVEAINHIIDFGLDPGTPPTDDLASGHGTHVAGIVAGNGYYARANDFYADPALYGGDGVPIGIAPKASLVSVKTGDVNSAGLLLFAMDWTIVHHADYGIRTVNVSAGCSGGCSYDPAGLEAEYQKGLYDAGIVAAFAAGNDAGTSDGASFSGDSQSPYVLSVASYDHRAGVLSSFSSRGSSATTLPDPATWDPANEAAAGQRRPDIGAPGSDIYSSANLTGGEASLVPRFVSDDNLLVGTTTAYRVMSGTSMATPHVTGAATLLFSACPAARPLDVMRALLVAARSARVRTTDGSRLAAAWEIGYGALDVRGALDWLRANVTACQPPNVAPTAAITAPATGQARSALSLSGASSSDADGRIVSYAWDFGDGTTGTGASPGHTYAWDGTYPVKLTVTDDRGATATSTRTVVVRDDPAAGRTRVYADGLSRHKCATSAWSFSLTKLATATDVPADITVTWGDGSRERVALASFKSGRATYTSGAHLASPVAQAWADVPSGWGGLFTLDTGPC